jgi:hypothetical protein
LFAALIVEMAFAGVARSEDGSSPSSSAAEVDFGDVATTGSRVSSFTITNQLDSPMLIDQIRTSNEAFRVDYAHSTCPSSDGSLGPGESCSLSIEFAPSGPGNWAGLLTIVGSPRKSPQIVRLRGQNGPPEPSSAITVDVSQIPDTPERPDSGEVATFVLRPMPDKPGGVATAIPPGTRIVSPALRSPGVVAKPAQQLPATAPW